MAQKARKKITTVREHPMHVPIRKRNPTGITVRDRHLRRLKGTYLDTTEIKAIFKNYHRKDLAYPAKGKLTKKYKNADDYTEHVFLLLIFISTHDGSLIFFDEIVKCWGFSQAC